MDVCGDMLIVNLQLLLFFIGHGQRGGGQFVPGLLCPIFSSVVPSMYLTTVHRTVAPGNQYFGTYCTVVQYYYCTSKEFCFVWYYHTFLCRSLSLLNVSLITSHGETITGQAAQTTNVQQYYYSSLQRVRNRGCDSPCSGDTRTAGRPCIQQQLYIYITDGRSILLRTWYVNYYC